MLFLILYRIWIFFCKNLRNRSFQPWHIICCSGPNDRPIDRKVGMNCDISKAYDISPFNLLMLSLKLLGQTSCRFADYS